MNTPTPPPFDNYRIEEDDFVLQPPQSPLPDDVVTPEKSDEEPISAEPHSVAETDDLHPDECKAEDATQDEGLKTDNPEIEDDGRLVSIEKKIESLTNVIENMTNELEENFRQATNKAELFDRMYAEMAKYKDDLYAKLLKPFILETITILEDYRRTLERLDSLTPEQTRNALKNIPADLEDLLGNNGVDILVSEEDNPLYDRKLHQIVRTVETDNPELDGKIAKRLRPGYAWNGITLRQEKVEVYKLKK
ncbi:MAG: nucleotide exchange factor GrpE [Muribaculaceae bacterium]|nr:nucleotide exchange factor GrpE [Muribaculaceae bacterium]